MLFVDTSFWVAVRNRRDEHHTDAATFLRYYADDHLITTNHVRGETWTFLPRRVGHAAAVDMLEALDRSPRLRVISVHEDAETETLRWLHQHNECEYSFVDATSFAVMRSLRVHRALAFDGDFTAAGFQEVRPSL